MEIYVDDDAKLTLHGLLQYYIKLEENEKVRPGTAGVAEAGSCQTSCANGS